MRIAFQVNVISRFAGTVGVEKSRHFLILPAKLTSMSDEMDSREFADCAARAESEALAIVGARLDISWTSSVQDIEWQILP
jgi:hypothetical protein